MRRFKHILVVGSTDHETTRNVLADAVDLARRNEASITLFGAAEPVGRSQQVTLSDGQTLDLATLVSRDLRRTLEAEAQEVRDVPIEVRAASGIPFLEVIRTVTQDGHDLVITAPDAGRRRFGLAGASTTMHLLRKCPVPVWVRTADSVARPDVVVAVGPFGDGADDAALNIMLLELGASLAAIRHGMLHVVHAWRLEGETLLRRRRSGISPERVNAMVAGARRDAAAALDQLLEYGPEIDVPAETHLEKGDAGTVVPDLVETLQPGVVVMGTLARTGISGVFMGNTAERLLGTIDASILAVKPPGFVSPVAP